MQEQANYWERRRRMALTRRRFIGGTAVLAAGSAAMLAGCGDDDDNGGKTATATSQGGGASPSATSAGTPQSGGSPTGAQGKKGGTVKATKYAADTGLDPAITVTNALHPAKAYSHMLVYQLSSNKYYLDLAKSFEQAEPTRMVFKLRDGLKFNPEVAGGRALTAADVAYSFGRFPSTLKNFGSEVNAVQWSWMDSFETPDDKTVVIKLKTPYASAIPSMGSSAFAVVAKELVEANGGKLSDVMNAGSGPYMMKKRESTGTRYERNPNYFKHTPAEGPFVEDGPYVDAWEEAIIADPATLEARFLAGDSDFLAITIDKLKADELKSNKGVVIEKATCADNFQVQLDFEKWAPHPKLREALSLAIDRDQYIKTLYLNEGQLGSPVGPVFDSVLSQAELKTYQKYDPARAKQLWNEGGGNTVFPNGFRTISATFSAFAQTQVDFVKRQLEQNLGVKVTVTPADLAAYVSVATARQKDWEFFMASENSLSTIPDYNALTFYVPTGYGSIFGNERLDSPIPETAAFAKQALDWFTKQSQELDAAKRKQILRDMQIFMLQNFAPALPLPVAQFTYGAHRDRIKNYPTKDFQLGNASMGVYRSQNLYIDG